MPNPKMKTMGKECICQSCAIFSDDFSTDRTGTDYSVRSGSWSVGSGKLSTTSASALIREETAVPGGLAGVYASCSMKMATTGDKGRLVIAYVDDSNYWFVELQPGGSDGTLSLFHRSGGTNTQIGTSRTAFSLNANDEVSVSLCYDGVKLKASAQVGVSAIAGFIHTAAITVAGTKCGLGTGSGSSSVIFDDFTVNKQYVDDVACSPCTAIVYACTRCSGTIPERVQVVLPADLVNSGCTNCAAFAGTYVCDYDGVDASPCQWTYLFPAGTSPCSAYDRIVVTMDDVAGPSTPNVTITLTDAFSSIKNIWSKTYGSAPDCNAWSSESIPIRGNSLGPGNCLIVGGTTSPALLTSL